jgi:protein-S-isoprenylcysteine O-methyltransferase Ste14
MPDRIFKAVYCLGLLVEMAIRVPYDRRRQREHVIVDRVTGQERLLIGLLFVGMFFVPAAYMLTPWLDRADYRWPPRTRARAGGVGSLIFATALWLFWRSHADLRQNWSPSLQLREGHELVTVGVYRHIRHPMYASGWLWGLAQPLLLQNWVAGWASLLLFPPLYLIRVPREEQMMREHFGEAYERYMRRTGRVIPGFGRQR